MPVDIDIVADLNAGDGPAVDTTIPAETGNAAHGVDAVIINGQNPPATQAKIVAPEPKPEGEKPASIRDIISGALKAETATPEAAQQDGRARNPDGTFAAKTPAELAADDAAQVLDPNAPKPAPVTAAPVGIDPAVFASLPAETQANLARTMEDVATQQKRFASLAPIEQLIAPRIDAWALNGMQPQTALNQLLALSDFAGRDIQGFIKYMARENNVDLEAMVLGMDDEPPVNPELDALRKEVNDLKTARNTDTQQQQQAKYNALVDNVLAFADEKAQDGTTPLRPHLSELGSTWLPYIEMVKAQNPNWSHTQVLQQAYENACWNNASVRGKMQAGANAAAEAERLRKETERVAAARVASKSVASGAPTSTPEAPNEGNRSIRDTIKAAMAAQQ